MREREPGRIPAGCFLESSDSSSQSTLHAVTVTRIPHGGNEQRGPRLDNAPARRRIPRLPFFVVIFDIDQTHVND